MTEPTTQAPPRLTCLGGCGKSWADGDEAEKAGIEFLAVARAWRCGVCTRELLQVAVLSDDRVSPIDELPRDSRGALSKDTSATIVAPRVKA